ncbi:EI24 domain-containing protein [Helicobacter sp. MIT 21-1697]|uniref:EI24 domain-containing protein n=1 Tax=Helicobacter sp. MIT 21-1697 TaxID=2993733 RepID=UPI00224ACE71|nr:EI24 domain-containing protein [Helicobacter sp. MIT 21-1697]MCX2716922.1 EI24 domain-containing protein [Helicobacter sp. MIT 21-1697]
MLHILNKSIKDFFSLKILLITFVPAILGLLLWGSVIYYYGQELYNWTLGLMPEWLMSVKFLGNILNIVLALIVYTLLGLWLVLMILLTNVFFSIFYTPLIVSFVRKKDFPHIPQSGFGTLGECLGEFFKNLCIFVPLFILSFLLYFIPLLGSTLGFIALLVLGYLFFKSNMFYDIGSSCMDKVQFENLNQTYRLKNHSYALLAYLPSFVPFLNFFLMPLQMLIITHYFFTHIHIKMK